MADYAYDRLSFLDNYFLMTESPTNHMHVAGVATYEAGSLRTPEGGIDIERIRDYVASRLRYTPRYRQVLAHVPIERWPVWVDDPHFNIHYHVRHTSLPRPGDERQLKRLSARIMSQQLDRSKPLWEMWIVEGLEGGDRFAMVAKIHHCMVDGISSVDLMTVLLSPEPAERFEPAPPFAPRRAPTPAELLEAEARRRVRESIDAALHLRRTARRADDPTSDLRVAARAARSVIQKNMQRASNTPLNQPIGPHRRFDWMPMDLQAVKAVRRSLGGSINDIVLTTVTGAVRRFLQARGVEVAGLDFRVMAPVSVRQEGERGTLGNRVSAWMVDLPLDERDPRKCLARIRATTDRLKTEKSALGAEVLTKVVSWTPQTLLSLGSRMALRNLPFNLVVTNVPGPQVPLYLLGSRMLENYGLVPLTDYLGLGIVLFSYAGTLCWGFNADWDLLPDLHDFVLSTEASFHELEEAARAPEIGASAGAASI